MMAKSSLFLIPLVALLVGNGCAWRGSDQQGPAAVEFSLSQFRELLWLEGTWWGAAEGEAAFFEAYRFANDLTIEITYFADSTLTTRTGTGSVALRARRIFHEWEDARWVAAAMDTAGVHFAPIAGASNDFTWAHESADAWIATLREPGGAVTVYRLERIGAERGSGARSRSFRQTAERGRRAAKRLAAERHPNRSG